MVVRGLKWSDIVPILMMKNRDEWPNLGYTFHHEKWIVVLRTR